MNTPFDLFNSPRQHFNGYLCRMASAARLSPARVVIGVDFGTTYSGFSFALKSDANIKAADG